MTETVEIKTGSEAESVVAEVRRRYAGIARVGGSCCGPEAACGSGQAAAAAEGVGYSSAELAELGDANLGLGCGAPIAQLTLAPGETVLDLGSGPGLDCFLAAKQVGPHGRVIGVDMTPEMLARARNGAAKLGLGNVEFREGRLEALPVADASVDAVTSNCVINLVPDKGAVFREVARVLRPGGRLVISDIVLDGRLPEAVERDVYAYVGCISGAAQRAEYFGLLASAGLSEIEVLKDVDYVGVMAATAPEELNALLGSVRVPLSAVTGKVRSLTFRARKP
jgi:SAM-dependent methyltransferase